MLCNDQLACLRLNLSLPSALLQKVKMDLELVVQELVLTVQVCPTSITPDLMVLIQYDLLMYPIR